jgi:imidazolonepropionase-like amidohydrolase
VRAITLNVATILGVDQHWGSLETGKTATLCVSDGDALDMRSNRVSLAFIEGREIDLDQRQRQLYRKFQEKYNAPIFD